MEQLIGKQNHLKAKGIFEPDNPITALVYTNSLTIVSYVIFNSTISNYLNMPQNISEQNLIFDSTLLLPTLAIVNAVGLIAFPVFKMSKIFDTDYDSAKYLDDKIKILYNGNNK